MSVCGVLSQTIQWGKQLDRGVWRHAELRSCSESLSQTLNVRLSVCCAAFCGVSLRRIDFKVITVSCYSNFISFNELSSQQYEMLFIKSFLPPSDPCEAGSYYSCSARTCLPCEVGTFQPVWGQTSCWSCPPNTTTDSVGAASPASCKHTACVHNSRPGLAILQSPNYPASLPLLTSCHWRVEPGPGVSVLMILPSLSLPPGCSHTLTVRRGPRTVFSSCQATDGPLLVTSQVDRIVSKREFDKISLSFCVRALVRCGWTSRQTPTRAWPASTPGTRLGRRLCLVSARSARGSSCPWSR